MADDYRVSLDSAPLLLTFHASAGALRTMRDAIDAALGSAMLRSPPIAPPKETIAPPAADDDEDEDED